MGGRDARCQACHRRGDSRGVSLWAPLLHTTAAIDTGKADCVILTCTHWQNLATARLITKRTAIGKSRGIIMERPILALLAMKQDTPCEGTTAETTATAQTGALPPSSCEVLAQTSVPETMADVSG